MAEAKAIAVQDLAQSVTAAVLRALASQAEFKSLLGKSGPGLIAHPIVTVGGMIYFGEAGRFAGRTIGSTEVGMG
ncbi:MAG TPA: hypothetical protein VJT32_11840 [bacterium]|nr:hypothetical protein [bacterium]